MYSFFLARTREFRPGIKPGCTHPLSPSAERDRERLLHEEKAFKLPLLAVAELAAAVLLVLWGFSSGLKLKPIYTTPERCAAQPRPCTCRNRLLPELEQLLRHPLLTRVRRPLQPLPAEPAKGAAGLPYAGVQGPVDAAQAGGRGEQRPKDGGRQGQALGWCDPIRVESTHAANGTSLALPPSPIP